MKEKSLRKPKWLKTTIVGSERFAYVNNIVEKNCLHTICASGRCPNRSECWNRGTATFMILGDICTRSCRFCNTKTGKPKTLDLAEPAKIAESVKLMGLSHAVITSVDRDDLPDLGVAQWVATIAAIQKINPTTTIEVLIPDFQGRKSAIQQIIEAAPTIIGHNLETVRRLTPSVRSAARYDTSLSVLQQVVESGIPAKSSLMLGLGETVEEVLETMDDLREVCCSILTLGQYLQPTANHLPVSEYIHPDRFAEYKRIALEKGFRSVESGPLVRSSYHAERLLP
ncbi:MAG: lipoyl synthase [Paludibacteraceae bacterium]|jgi:lipoic acid synthetase|nr:lipoyl synthase [Paludibacteraceae bacterium]MDI9536387.1 lipoyl synthase [Bacteroidota bacterium]HHT61628.1 lipoyl synthase [Bacteroidales bacterium]MBP9038866.1 lipoyl synthase [Paludibacteraceae bacterium]HOA45864.1 lipoyl synthase [Paludibacteraceae bacterium]